MRVCAEPGCPTLVKVGTRGGRCGLHARAKDKARGTRQQRGYDARHERIRASWAPIVAAGKAVCWRCRQPLVAGKPWHLGHDDHDRSVYRGPECVPCNTATAGR